MDALNTPAALRLPDAYELLTADLGSNDGDHAVFIHTTRASLALDDNGICRDVFRLDGSELTQVERCVGAQYIASVDAQGIIGKPSVGGHALLVAQAGGSPPAVIKTAAITGVVYSTDVIEA
jgi:hypothetical protein